MFFEETYPVNNCIQADLFFLFPTGAIPMCLDGNHQPGYLALLEEAAPNALIFFSKRGIALASRGARERDFRLF